jgi:predicted alpha/beta-hydrolase family hydrolase
VSAQVDLLIDGPRKPRATLVLAHGAGAPMDSPFMEAIAKGLAAQQLSVVRFEFAYMARRRRDGVRAPPDRMPLLEARFREVLASLKPAGPCFLGGKSMGSRVAVQLADELSAAGVVALGYPFHPPKQTDKLRLEPLRALRTRCLIVQGTRDALGDRAEVAGYGLAKRVRVCWLEDGDHSFVPRKSKGRTEAQNLAEAVAAVSAFMRR